MADRAYYLSDPSALVPEDIRTNTPFAAWFYSVYLRLKNGIKFSVQKAATQSINDSSATKVTWSTTINNDSIGGWDSTNNRYVIQMEGTYFFHAAVLLSGAISGGKVLKVMLYKNGVVIRETDTLATTTTSTTAAVSAYIDLSPTDYVEVYVYHTVGGATNIAATPEHTYFQGHRIN
jgi:hypothetical protein